MAIINTLAPKPVVLSRNAVPMEFSVPDKYITAGARNRTLLLFNSLPDTDGDMMQVSYPRHGVNIVRTITFRDDPDADLLEARTWNAGTDTLPGWLPQVIDALRGDAALASDWTLGLHADDPIYGIEFRAEYEGSSNIAVEATGFTRTLTHLTNAAEAVARDNYRMTATLYLSRDRHASGTLFDRTATIEMDAAADAKTRIDWREYLDAMMDGLEPRPENIVPMACDTICRTAYVVYGQKWGAPAVSQKNYVTGMFRVLKGGMTDRDFDSIDDLGAWLHTRFLTARKVRTVGVAQDDYLYWYCNADLGAITLRVNVTFASGVSQFWDFTLPNAQAGVTYKFRVNLAEITASVDASNARVFAKVVLFADSWSTEAIQYRVVEDWNELVFEHENTFGGIESWKFTGGYAVENEGSSEQYTTTDANGSPVLRKYAERNNVVLKVNTGPLTAEEAAAFPDFLRSKHVWVVRNGKRIAVRPADAKVVSAHRDSSGGYVRVMNFAAHLPPAAAVSDIAMQF